MLDTEHNGTEISLTENAIRCDMHPADQYEAFAKLHGEDGMSAEDIAARFGVTAAVVEGAALGRLYPEPLIGRRSRSLLPCLVILALPPIRGERETRGKQAMSSAFRTRNRLRCRSKQSQPSTIWKINFGGRDRGAKSPDERPKFWSLRHSSPRRVVQVSDMSSLCRAIENSVKSDRWLVVEVGLELRQAPPEPGQNIGGRKLPWLCGHKR
jgi:hypothetical protein